MLKLAIVLCVIFATSANAYLLCIAVENQKVARLNAEQQKIISTANIINYQTRNISTIIERMNKNMVTYSNTLDTLRRTVDVTECDELFSSWNVQIPKITTILNSCADEFEKKKIKMVEKISWYKQKFNDCNIPFVCLGCVNSVAENAKNDIFRNSPTEFSYKTCMRNKGYQHVRETANGLNLKLPECVERKSNENTIQKNKRRIQEKINLLEAEKQKIISMANEVNDRKTWVFNDMGSWTKNIGTYSDKLDTLRGSVNVTECDEIFSSFNLQLPKITNLMNSCFDEFEKLKNESIEELLRYKRRYNICEKTCQTNGLRCFEEITGEVFTANSKFRNSLSERFSYSTCTADKGFSIITKTTNGIGRKFRECVEQKSNEKTEQENKQCGPPNSNGTELRTGVQEKINLLVAEEEKIIEMERGINDEKTIVETFNKTMMNHSDKLETLRGSVNVTECDELISSFNVSMKKKTILVKSCFDEFEKLKIEMSEKIFLYKQKYRDCNLPNCLGCLAEVTGQAENAIFRNSLSERFSYSTCMENKGFRIVTETANGIAPKIVECVNRKSNEKKIQENQCRIQANEKINLLVAEEEKIISMEKGINDEKRQVLTVTETFNKTMRNNLEKLDTLRGSVNVTECDELISSFNVPMRKKTILVNSCFDEFEKLKIVMSEKMFLYKQKYRDCNLPNCVGCLAEVTGQAENAIFKNSLSERSSYSTCMENNGFNIVTETANGMAAEIVECVNRKSNEMMIQENNQCGAPNPNGTALRTFVQDKTLYKISTSFYTRQ